MQDLTNTQLPHLAPAPSPSQSQAFTPSHSQQPSSQTGTPAPQTIPSLQQPQAAPVPQAQSAAQNATLMRNVHNHRQRFNKMFGPYVKKMMIDFPEDESIQYPLRWAGEYLIYMSKMYEMNGSTAEIESKFENAPTQFEELIQKSQPSKPEPQVKSENGGLEGVVAAPAHVQAAQTTQVSNIPQMNGSGLANATSATEAQVVASSIPYTAEETANGNGDGDAEDVMDTEAVEVESENDAKKPNLEMPTSHYQVGDVDGVRAKADAVMQEDTE